MDIERKGDDVTFRETQPGCSHRFIAKGNFFGTVGCFVCFVGRTEGFSS
jgi:hypothetical protein